MLISKDGSPILTLEDWLRLAKPKSKAHWKDHRSAKEAARSWLAASASGAVPPEIAGALQRSTSFGVVEEWAAEPEVQLPFDDFPGEPRNSDLLVRARDANGNFLIAVEAKADESFGETVAEALAAAVDRKLSNPRSNGVARIEGLASALFGPRREGEPPIGKLRYQLLTATAGALRAAIQRQADRVILLVQEFKTIKTTDIKHGRNDRDLRLFLRRLAHAEISGSEEGHLWGPLRVPGEPLFRPAPDLYVGKVTSNLRDSRA